METLTLSAHIGEDRRVVIHLPDDTPIGDVELVIHVVPRSETTVNVDRETIRAKLLAANFLVTSHHAPAGAHDLSQDEIFELGRPAPDGRSSLYYINEDRGDY